MNTYYRQRGAVSLFVVIFAALLITTITIAFVRVMVQNQQQATTADLSKSALDSAFAGVEDAKRAIVEFKKDCYNSDGEVITSERCDVLATALRSNKCRTIQEALFAELSEADEVLIKQSDADEDLQQAYTCVKVRLDTPDYVGNLVSDASHFIPLKAKATDTFNKVVIRWYAQRDLQTAESEGAETTVNFADPPGDVSLPPLEQWPVNRPPLIRVQLIQFGDSFNLSSFNDNEGGKTNTATHFLMPASIGRKTVAFIEDKRQEEDGRRPVVTSSLLSPIDCAEDFSTTSGGQFACEVTMTLPRPIGADDDKRTAYLLINQFYKNDTAFSISMLNQANEEVLFDGVQPEIDATGRANDLFRRVKSRVEDNASSTPPLEAAVDITGSLCKNFLVTGRTKDYDPGDC